MQSFRMGIRAAVVALAIGAGTLMLAACSRQQAEQKAGPVPTPASMPAVGGATGSRVTLARVGNYRPWGQDEAAMDAGWTQWLLEQYGFAPKARCTTPTSAPGTCAPSST